MKKSCRLIAFDLDGTLLDNKKRLAPETLDALRAAGEAGILLVPATGRIPAGIRFSRSKSMELFLMMTPGHANFSKRFMQHLADFRERNLKPWPAVRNHGSHQEKG